MTTISTPGRVAPHEIRRRVETADGGFEVGIVVDAASHGSEVLLGLQWVAPGTERVTWTADDATHEVYHVVAGRLRLRWDGPTSGDEDLSEGDSFFFPPGYEYSVENLGDERAFVVWAMTPAEG